MLSFERIILNYVDIPIWLVKDKLHFQEDIYFMQMSLVIKKETKKDKQMKREPFAT